MTAFSTDGFLSTEITEFEQAITARYTRKLQLAMETNRLTHQVIYAATPHNEHALDLMLAALLVRQASAFQGVLILLEKGLETQAQILLRNLAEMLFITGAIRKDESFFNQYVLAEDVSRLKSLEALAMDKQSRGEEIDEETKKLIETLRKKIGKEKTSTFTTERIARIAGFSSYYDTLYRFTSMAVHASPRELNTVFELDSRGIVVSMKYGPVVEDLDVCLDYSTSMMLYALHEIASHFKLDVIQEIERLQNLNAQFAGPPSQSAEAGRKQ